MTYDEFVDKLVMEAMRPITPLPEERERPLDPSITAARIHAVLDLLTPLLVEAHARAVEPHLRRSRENRERRVRQPAATPSEPIVPLPKREIPRPAPSGLAFERRGFDPEKARLRALEAI